MNTHERLDFFLGFLTGIGGIALAVASIILLFIIAIYVAHRWLLRKEKKAVKELSLIVPPPIEALPEVVEANKPWNLFIDDIRETDYVKDGRTYILARTVDEAIELINTMGLPAHIAFDHDLGWDTLLPIEGSVLIAAPVEGKELPSGHDFAKWLVDQDINGTLNIPETFTWSVHSSNPVGVANINGVLSGYMKHKFQKSN